jgi:hypothetical protein
MYAIILLWHCWYWLTLQLNHASCQHAAGGGEFG